MSKTSLETTSAGHDFFDLYKEEEDYWWSVARRRLVSRFLSKYCPVGGRRLIDVGCGGGGFLRSLTGYGNLFGLELSELGTAYAARAGVRIIRGDVENLPLKDGSFDIVTSLDVVEHLNDGAALRDLYRIVAPGGFIVLTVPALNLLWSPRDTLLGHRRRYTVKGLKRLLEKSGFKVIRCSYTNAFYFPALLFYAIFRRVFGHGKPKTAVLSVPPMLAWLFGLTLRVEECVLLHLDLPIGTSIICLAKKDEDKKGI